MSLHLHLKEPSAALPHVNSRGVALLSPPGHRDDLCGWIMEAQLHSSWVSFWWRWVRYGLSILSSGLLVSNAPCFPLSFLRSIIPSVVISLQGGKVAGALASRAAAASFSFSRFAAEHTGLIQIHDHISFMALQLWVRCFFAHRHVSRNVILHACTPPTPPPTRTPHTIRGALSVCVLTHEADTEQTH